MIHETLGPGLHRTWDLDQVLCEEDTEFQHLVIARTAAQGVALFCDGDRQSTEFSQLTYHEALAVPALLLTRRLDRVLVIGSSEGVLSQICVTAGAVRVDHVDIDEDAVRLCARHLPYGYTEAELAAAERGEGPIRVRYADGFEFVRAAAEQGAGYDLVLIDLPDEGDADEQHNRLYAADFLKLARAALAPGGVVAGQAGCPTLWRNETLIRSVRRFTEVFATVSCFTSDEHEWSFLAGLADPLADPVAVLLDRLPALPYRPATLDADALRSRTVLPFHVRAALRAEADRPRVS
jgi:spermidine synthase